MKPCNHTAPVEGCHVCHLFETRADYRALWNGAPLQCIKLGAPTGHTVSCPTCRGRVELKVFACAEYGECTLAKSVDGMACCNGRRGPDGTHHPCDGYATEWPRARARGLRWAYGVTTVPERRHTLLPTTLASLAAGGFDRPRLFIDGATDDREFREFGLETTCRMPTIRTHGNWILSLYELYIREPAVDRYAVFQDDMVTYRNLRQYLESCEYPAKGYWNLYTFPANQELANGRTGWYPSNQFGRGAVALVFSLDAVLELLSSRHMVERPRDPNRGWKAVDGGIVTAMAKAGWREYVHNPSLVQHTGKISSMRNRPHKSAVSFRGEEFDALAILSR